MLAIDEITELSIRKKNGLVTMELKFLSKEGDEHNIIIKDEVGCADDVKKCKPFFVKGNEIGPVDAETGYLLYKYSYPLRNYLIDLFGWK